MDVHARRLVALVLASLLASCTPEATVPEAPVAQTEDTAAAVAAEATMQPSDMVDLTVYLRRGRGRAAHLAPAVREVPVSDELPRTALELLIARPGEDDPRGLRHVLPHDAGIRRFEVRDATAVVDFTSGVARGESATWGPNRGFLALSAIANTLTEFPDIDYVRATVDGKRGGDAWGGWGMPPILVRDKGVVEPVQRVPPIATPDAFDRRPQRVGVRRSRPLRVSALRVRPTATYVRITAEITGSDDGPQLIGPVPPSTARRAGKAIVLRIRGRGRNDLAGSLRAKFDDPLIQRVRVRLRPERGTVVVRIRPRRERAFWLHTLPKPARVVLDIRR